MTNFSNNVEPQLIFYVKDSLTPALDLHFETNGKACVQLTKYQC